MSDVWGTCGSGAFATWKGCGTKTRPAQRIDDVNAQAVEDGWLLVYTPNGTVEAFVCPACRPGFKE